MTQNQFDFLLDNKANRIGTLLLHLSANEKLYQLNTFENMDYGKFEKAQPSSTGPWRWTLANLPARRSKAMTWITTGTSLREGREKTFAEFRGQFDVC
jgi:hypothetical protein